MHRKTAIITIGVILVIALARILLKSLAAESLKGMLIFCQVTVDETDMDYRTGGVWRYPPRTRIVAVDPEKPEETLKVLTAEFYSARAPEISYDGRRLLFTGQQKEGEPWQIWELNLEDLRARQITSGLKGCTDPAYLPDSRIVYSNLTAHNTTGVGHTLYTCALDGSEVKRITFHPHSDFAPTVLRDGRLLIISRELYPAPGAATLLVLRPDGTKAELFYHNRPAGWPSSRGWETSAGQVVFIESQQNYSFGGSLVTVSTNRPLHSRNVLTAGIEGDFHSAYPLPSGKLIVSYRQSELDRYALYEFDPLERRLGQLILSDPDYHALEPVMVAERPRPKKLPSVVNEQQMTGWLLCLNSDLSDLPVTANRPASATSRRVRVSGIQEEWGEVPLEEDGSFYIEITADTPLRFQTISGNDQVVRGPSAWVWVRPNERRGCVGCHEDRELTPENQVPRAVTKPPVSLSSPLSQHLAEGKP